MTWTRLVQLERQEWVSKRGSWAPFDETRNVKQHTETYWENVTDMTPGAPDMNGIPGPSVATPRMELRTRSYYTYEALEWHKGRTLRAWGTSPGDVAWPEYTLESGERVRDLKESYEVTFTTADKRYEASLTEQEWRGLEPGLACHLSLGLFGGVKKVAQAR